MKKAKLEMAKDLLSQGLDISMIKQCTRIFEQDIAKFISQEDSECI